MRRVHAIVSNGRSRPSPRELIFPLGEHEMELYALPLRSDIFLNNYSLLMSVYPFHTIVLQLYT